MNDFQLGELRHASDGFDWLIFRCPKCGRVAGANYNRLGCRTGHEPTLMGLVFETDPDTPDSPDVDVFIP